MILFYDGLAMLFVFNHILLFYFNILKHSISNITTVLFNCFMYSFFVCLWCVFIYLYTYKNNNLSSIIWCIYIYIYIYITIYHPILATIYTFIISAWQQYYRFGRDTNQYYTYFVDASRLYPLRHTAMQTNLCQCSLMNFQDFIA